MIEYFRKYPALTYALLASVAVLVLKFVPGVELGAIEDVIAAAVSLIAGAAVHRSVSPVSTADRGFRSREAEFVEPFPTQPIHFRHF